MSRTFHYIQNDDVLKSFMEFKDTILSERPVVVARHGDYSLFLTRISGSKLGLSIENTSKKAEIEKRTYETDKTTNDLVSRGVRHAIQKMAELSDEDTDRKRLQIWKWYVMDWQQANADKTEEVVNKELSWEENESSKDKEVLDIESFLHGEYLNVGNTISLIEKYLKDEKHKEMFKTFAINDIMEMTSEDTRDKSLAEAERRSKLEGGKTHTYQFLVSVEATDKEHARKALLSYLAGDDRIKIQK